MRCPPKTHKLSLKGIGGEEDTGDEETSLWAELHGLWSTRPRPGHGGDLATAGFIWHFLPSSQEIVHGCTRSSLFCYQNGPEDWKLSSCHSSALWDLRQGQSEAEASVLSEWVQIAMAKLIRMIWNQESRVTTFCFTLYCADTGHNTGHKTF